jgi:hypothetical protein
METCKVKTLYENELGRFHPSSVSELNTSVDLDDAKKLIEELAHEKSRLEIELEKSRSENNDVLNK